MSDNFDVTPGSGKTVATDDIGGIHYQRAKMVWGADGTANDVDTAAGKPMPVQSLPQTSGGLSRTRTLIPNNTTAIVVKSGAGQLYKIRATNNSATIAYIKIYDATSATAGSGTPVDTIMIPASTSGAGVVDTTDLGVSFSTGITYIVTTGIADNDTGAPAANAYVVSFYYK
ncbi:hypothetical protein [Bradyrhizobium elkanii]|uniref:hypothetical protein n=1 Tax=Bradyrhizobium elkanii TaxID=29448 RepID=UPI001448E877|nr:hypothetical protein [Bradyrhizobium elkanii]MCS3577761.1 hypothetical protein [Bradyrhizobium elkanii]MCS3720636.1 hypothetical protein [Bradyrhizobium elkanii]MCS4005053.1 hypothetical protein [Bradyrhizobium elkanii USDA 61]MCW2130321.1 hypothetical protein [Bradyrhizobium elkanii]MCW2167997.1 hypothetical protein [Bradyrhizobium elkanii]